MKKTVIQFSLLGALLFTSCEKKTSKLDPEFAPTPVMTPELTPEPTPEPTPEVRVTTDGAYYVVHEFSVTTDYGIHGFPSGKRPQLVREEAGMLVVTDGEVEATVAKGTVSNDLDPMEPLFASLRVDRVQRVEAQEIRNDQIAEKRNVDLQNAQSQQAQQTQNARLAETRTLGAAIDALDIRIRLAERELENKDSMSQSRREYWRDGILYTQAPKIITLSLDASRVKGASPRASPPEPASCRNSMTNHESYNRSIADAASAAEGL